MTDISSCFVEVVDQWLKNGNPNSVVEKSVRS